MPLSKPAARFLVTDDFVRNVNKVGAAHPGQIKAVSLIDRNRKTGALLFPSAEGPWAEFPGGTITIIEDEAGEQLTAEIILNGKPVTHAAFLKRMAA